MNAIDLLTKTGSDRSFLLIRLLAGWVFLAEGIQKFLFPEVLGVGRFLKIGIPAPEIMAPFVGGVEIAGGILLFLGLLTRPAALLLTIDILVAIGTTKIPMLEHDGFWKAAHEARTDLSMFFACLFLLLNGAGGLSMDRKFWQR
jgi:uncharacterized membrane protein YphA (DoxX/SURF4 family)